MSKDILLVAHFCSDFDGKGNNRFNYLAEILANHGFGVELVTSDFSHNKKSKREKEISEHLNYKVTFIEEPIYEKNVSLKRFYSHYKLSTNLKVYLETRKKPDLIYCSVPSLDVASTAAKYAKRNNIKFIIDIQDLWPEAFRMVYNIPVISTLLFRPMQRKADHIYASADEIIAVSKTYADRASIVNKKCKEPHVIYLGTELRYFDKIAEVNRVQKPDNEIWLAYAGTLGHSYDLKCVIDALHVLSCKGHNNIKFIVMGDGPLRSSFENYAKSKNIYVEFTGKLDYERMVGLLKSCDIAVNPIIHDSAASIINKHADYAAAGLPVLNTQESKEYKDLVEDYYMGFNCINGEFNDLAEKLSLLIKNYDIRNTMGMNSRKLAEERFDRLVTYNKIIDILNDLLD